MLKNRTARYYPLWGITTLVSCAPSDLVHLICLSKPENCQPWAKLAPSKLHQATAFWVFYSFTIWLFKIISDCGKRMKRPI